MSFYSKTKTKQTITNSDQIRKIVVDAISSMSDLVGSTLGPGGRNVIIEREGMSPLITKDGVSIARQIGVADAASNIVVDAAKEICLNTAKDAGDGTTTAIVLGNAIVKHGQEFLKSNPKYNPQRMINELKDAYDSVVLPYLKELSISVETEDQLRYVASISANGDKEIAEAAVKAVVAAGDDGTVLISESIDGKISVETIDGYIVTTGLKELGQIGPAFINDQANQQVKMDQGYVVLYDGALNDLKVPGLIQDAITDNGFHDATPIMVFAHDFAHSVLDKFAMTTKGGMTIVPVKTPRSGLPNGASMFLRDMAAYTNAIVYDPGNVTDMDEDGFGHFDTATVNMYETFVIGKPLDGVVDERIIELKSIEKAAFSEMDKSFLRAAIAKLTGGVSTVKVGGSSDLEIREKKDRVEDAVEAVRSAIAEGIVPGGCSIHLKMSHLLNGHKNKKPSWDILVKALKAPFELLISNCGEDPNLILCNMDSSTYGLPKKVFDAQNHEFVNPMEAGIIEPTKVVRVSINNALSVAALLTTLGGILCIPRNSEMEVQMELASQAFSQMMAAGAQE